MLFSFYNRNTFIIFNPWEEYNLDLIITTKIQATHSGLKPTNPSKITSSIDNSWWVLSAFFPLLTAILKLNHQTTKFNLFFKIFFSRENYPPPFFTGLFQCELLFPFWQLLEIYKYCYEIKGIPPMQVIVRNGCI